MATHKTTKTNRQVDVNSTFSKAVEKKSTNNVAWKNDIELPISNRYKKPQLQVNMASRKKVAFQEDGTVAGLGSSNEEENNQEEQANNSYVATGTQLSTTHTTNARRGNARGGGHCDVAVRWQSVHLP